MNPTCPKCGNEGVYIDQDYRHTEVFKSKRHERKIFKCEECGCEYTVDGIYNDDFVESVSIKEDSRALADGFKHLFDSGEE